MLHLAFNLKSQPRGGSVAAAHGCTERVEPSGSLVHEVASQLLIAVE
jgi:hypothetical protein